MEQGKKGRVQGQEGLQDMVWCENWEGYRFIMTRKQAKREGLRIVCRSD